MSFRLKQVLKIIKTSWNELDLYLSQCILSLCLLCCLAKRKTVSINKKLVLYPPFQHYYPLSFGKN